MKWMLYPVTVRTLAATLTLALGAGVAVAQPALPLPSAPLAVTGRVLQVESQWDAATTTIVTYVDIAVDRYIRGSGTAERLVLKQLGGRVGSIGLYIPEQARFEVGERALLLLAVSPRDGSLHTAGLGRGKLPADADAIAQVESAPLAARSGALRRRATRTRRCPVRPRVRLPAHRRRLPGPLARGRRRWHRLRRPSLGAAGDVDRLVGQRDGGDQPVARLRDGARSPPGQRQRAGRRLPRRVLRQRPHRRRLQRSRVRHRRRGRQLGRRRRLLHHRRPADGERHRPSRSSSRASSSSTTPARSRAAPAASRTRSPTGSATRSASATATAAAR